MSDAIALTHNPDGEVSGFSVKCPFPTHRQCKFCQGSGSLSFVLEVTDLTPGQPEFARFVSNWSRRVD